MDDDNETTTEPPAEEPDTVSEQTLIETDATPPAPKTPGYNQDTGEFVV